MRFFRKRKKCDIDKKFIKIESEHDIKDIIDHKDDIITLSFENQTYVDNCFIRHLFSWMDFPSLINLNLKGTSVDPVLDPTIFCVFDKNSKTRTRTMYCPSYGSNTSKKYVVLYIALDKDMINTYIDEDAYTTDIDIYVINPVKNMNVIVKGLRKIKFVC